MSFPFVVVFFVFVFPTCTNAIIYDCPPGTFYDVGALTCAKCKLGSVSSSVGALQDVPYLVNLIDTGAGKYIAPLNWNSGMNRCLYCTPGTYANSDATGCITCPVNSYNVPLKLPIYSNEVVGIKAYVPIGGYFSLEMEGVDHVLPQSRCFRCIQGFVQPLQGQSPVFNMEKFPPFDWYYIPFPVVLPDSPFPVYDASGNVLTPRNFSFADIVVPPGLCHPVPPGSYRTQSMTSPAFCPAGTYSAGPEGFDALTYVDPTSYTIAQKDFFQGAGFSGDDGFHGALPVVGTNNLITYIKIGGGDPFDDCIPCPEGTSSNNTGLASYTQCQDCPPGYYGELQGNDGTDWSPRTQPKRVCTQCPPGTYAPGNKSSSCIPAEPGTYVPGVGGGTSSIPCPVGTYSDGNGDRCNECRLGTFSNVTGSIRCTPAPLGTYVDTFGALVPIPCPKGTSTGIFFNSHNCTPCAPGYYSNSTGAIFCTPSPGGSFVAIQGGFIPEICPIATFSTPGSSACTTCFPGSYGPSPNSSACILCPRGTYSIAVGAISNTTCIPCEQRQYNSLLGANSSSQCLPCAPGSYTAEIGTPECTLANEGYIVANAGANESTICPGGTYSNAKGFSSCIPCRAGTYSLPGAAYCTECGAGSSSSTVGASSADSCVACAAGSFQPTAGQSSCVLCNPGSFAPTNGSVKCIPCPYGTASPVYGENRSSCAPCDIGHYAFPGFSTCKPCWAGSYTANTGSSFCTPCEEGKFSTQIGATSSTTCQSCGSNTYSFGGSACATCPAPLTTFVSSFRGCAPTGSSPVPDFFFSSSQAEGLVGMQFVNNPINVTFVADYMGTPAAAMYLSDGAFLALTPSPSSALASALPSGIAGDLTISANIKCAPESPSMVAVQWGGNASRPLNTFLSIAVRSGGPGGGPFDYPSARSLGPHPTERMTMSKDGKTVYTLYNYRNPKIVATDLDTQVETTLSRAQSESVIRPVLNADDTKLYFLHELADALITSIKYYDFVVMNLATRVETKLFSRIDSWKAYCISHDDAYIFIARRGPDAIKVYQLANLAATPEIIMSTTSPVSAMCISRGGDILYVKVYGIGGSTVSAYHRNDGSPLQSFTPFMYSATYERDAMGMMLTDDGKYLMVVVFDRTNGGGSSVYLDALTGQVKGIVGDNTEFGSANAGLAFQWPVQNLPVKALYPITQVPGKMSFYMFSWDSWYSPDIILLEFAPPAPAAGPCDGTWHHMAKVYSASAGTASFFVDGVLKSVSDVSVSRRRQLAANTLVLPSAGDSTLAIGWNGDLSVNDGALFSGSISDIRIYATAVNASSLVSLAAIEIPVYANAINPPNGYVAGVDSYSWSCDPGFYGPQLTLSKNASIAGGSWMFSIASSSSSTIAFSPLSNPLSSLCSPCAAGSYAPVAGLSTCLLCEAGSYSSDSTGAISCSGKCSPGTFSTSIGEKSDSVCVPCPIGYYTNTSGAAFCNICPLAQSTPIIGSTTCQVCGVGTYTQVNGSLTSCEPCQKGTFASSTGALACSTCAAGSYNNQIGQTSISACQSCPAGTSSVAGASQCNSCADGFSSVSGGPCLPCASGSVSTRSVVNGPTTCYTCGIGTFSNAFTNNQCLPCGRGTYSMSSGSSRCTACAPGSFTNNSNSFSCDACPAGSWSSYGAALCTPCMPGAYSTSSSGTSASSCMDCSAGYFSFNAGSSSCRPAPVGFFVAAPGQSLPSACSAGEYVNNTDALSCLQCPLGSFQSEVGSSSCVLASPGFYVSIEGATRPEICLAGNTSTLGARACTRCNPGFFSAVDGSPVCNPSAPGNYTPTSGSSEQLICPANSFSVGRASQCTSCPSSQAYSSSLLPGSSTCNCSVGNAWDVFNQVCNEQPKGQSVSLTFSYTIPALCSGNSLLNVTSLILDPSSGISSALRTSVASAAGYDPSAASITAVSICNTSFFVVVPNATINTVILTNEPPSAAIASDLLLASTSRRQRRRRVLISDNADLELISAADEISISVGIVMPQLLVAPVTSFLNAVVVQNNVDPALTSSLAGVILSTFNNAPPGAIVTSGSVSNGGASPTTLSKYFLAVLLSVANATNNATVTLVSSFQGAASSAVVPMLNSSNLSPNTPVSFSLKNVFIGGFIYFLAPSSSSSTIGISASSDDSSSSSQTAAIAASLVCLFVVFVSAFFYWRSRNNRKKVLEFLPTTKDVTNFEVQNPQYSKQ